MPSVRPTCGSGGPLGSPVLGVCQSLGAAPVLASSEALCKDRVQSWVGRTHRDPWVGQPFPEQTAQASTLSVSLKPVSSVHLSISACLLLSGTSIPKQENRGALGAQSAKGPTPDFSSGHVSGGEIEPPGRALCWVAEPLSVSPSAPPPPSLARSLPPSLSLENKTKQKTMPENMP